MSGASAMGVEPNLESKLNKTFQYANQMKSDYTVIKNAYNAVR